MGAAEAEWQRTPMPQQAAPAVDQPSVLQEARRQVVCAAFGESVQLIDVEAASEPSHPSFLGQSMPSSIFTVDGQPMITIPAECKPPERSIAEESRDAFV